MFIEKEPHPLLDAVALQIELPAPQGEESPGWLQQLLLPEAGPEEVEPQRRQAIRTLLRHGGYRPAGRGKPSSEWLVRAAASGKLATILPLVDAGNAASRMEGIPLSVVDLDRAMEPFRIAPGKPGERYIFNRSQQEIDIEGLLCLHDGEGPCANAVKDSQRTKTDETTSRVLIVVWGSLELPGIATRLAARVREVIERLGGAATEVEIRPGGDPESLQTGGKSH